MACRPSIHRGGGVWVGSLLLAILLPTASCSLAEPGEEPPESRFAGRVVVPELEGGFYGIVTLEGVRLDPGGLPDAFRREGLRVQGRFRPLEGRASVRMWGNPVELLHLEAIGGPPRQGQD